MSHAALLVCALLLDALLGEPDWLWRRLPHPAVLMGRLIGWCDARFNCGPYRKARGIAVMVVLGLGALALGAAIAALPLGWLWQVLIAAMLLAQRSLADHVGAVADALRLGLPEGRRAVARIVSRDTRGMDRGAVARGAIESAAENLSDGVVAPALWFLVAGLPGLLLYKITNTADSMIGYRTPRHLEFGWAAARFDDLLNLIPARVTALLIALVHGRLDAGRVVLRDAPLHRSPNAGWPEAAMAVCLDVQLSGPRSYDGAMKEFPLVHPEGQAEIGADEIDASVQALWRTWGALLVLVAGVALI
jgi:adenosylcobinamide-phosphate synthase